MKNRRGADTLKETRRADLHKINAKLSPNDSSCTCANTVFSRLILGLYFYCNAKGNRKCEPVNPFMLTVRVFMIHNFGEDF